MDKETQRKLDLLAALEAGGVENWDGYDLAIEENRKAIIMEELAGNIIDNMFSLVSEHIRCNSWEGYYLSDKGRVKAIKFLLSRANELKELCE